jgi:uncharacterized peroxidase-related enzyme|tara:strand:- start:23 stop:613 length:591 start_codon:yes stop_codon:yes gene_type:complete
MTAWIQMIQPEAAEGKLRDVYAAVTSPHGTVDNVMKVHSLQPKTMLGHLQLYKSILHNPDMTLSVGFLEIVASYTSMINNCAYSLTHHFNNARHLMADDARAERVFQALERNEPAAEFSGRELALLNYSAELTRNVGGITQSEVTNAKNEGCSDQEILEVNQVVAYFNYSNRVLNGLGVTTEGDVVGYYSNDAEIS